MKLPKTVYQSHNLPDERSLKEMLHTSKLSDVVSMKEYLLGINKETHGSNPDGSILTHCNDTTSRGYQLQ